MAFRPHRVAYRKSKSHLTLMPNGILNVSAKDLATGKEQKITITASSGLAEAEIEQMVKDAEANADEDQRKREEFEVRHRGDSLVYETEKNLKEFSDKIDAAVKSQVEGTVERLKEALKEDNIEGIKSATEDLTQVWHQASAELYKQAGSTETEIFFGTSTLSERSNR